MMTMINKEILDGIIGEGPLQANVRLSPIEQLRIRPNVIYDLVYDKEILHLGCTDHLPVIKHKIENGIYLHQQISRVAAVCVGIDINSEAVDYVRTMGITNIIEADITQPGIKQITDRKWDYLLMAEMLEHIDNPVSFLQVISQNYRNHIGSLIITVPNAFGITHMGKALNQGIESINNDHRYWFTPYTICKIAHQAGLIIDELIMCLSEYTVELTSANRELLLDKPVLLDSIVLVTHWA
jgi:2-polyprenyl-3-methyl-5-hydroxy-6-metoxy-1,4-benzoquinol methylase